VETTTQECPDLSLDKLNPPLNRVLITADSQLVLIEDFFNRVTEFCLDCEWNICERFVERKLRTIQIGNRDEQYIIDLLAFAGSPEALREQGNKQAPVWAQKLVETLSKALCTNRWTKVGVYLQSDLETLLWCLGMRVWGLYDCYLAEKVIYCGLVHFKMKGFWAMDDMVRRYMKLNLSKDLQTSFDLETPLTQAQIDYCALDVRLPLGIKGAQLKVIGKDGLARTVQVENDAIPAFAALHINGFFLDKEEWLKKVYATKIQHEENIKRLDTLFLPVVGDKNKKYEELLEAAQCAEQKWRAETDKTFRKQYREQFYDARRKAAKLKKDFEDFEGEACLAYSSPLQLLTVLRSMGYKLEDTNDKTLVKHEGDPVIDAIRDYRTTQKSLDSFGENFLEYIDPDTGRIHSNFSQLGAETGRVSSSNPNVQNIDNGEETRSCFRAQKPGRVLIIVDMAGAELRIMADLSEYKVWLDAFKKGWDVHSIGAEMMQPERWAAGTLEGCAYARDKQKCKCPVHKEIRGENKEINFGVAYGMEFPGLAGKLKCTIKRAKELLGLWRKVNRPLQDWFTKMGDNAKKFFEARTAIGRRRLFKRPDWEHCKIKAREKHEELVKEGKRNRPFTADDISKEYAMAFGSIERQGKNHPVQGGNGDILKIAIGSGLDNNSLPFLWHLLPKYNADFVNTVHDEIVIECDEHTAPACLEEIGNAIHRAGAMCLKNVDMEFEGAINVRWLK
jgi:DNA polymerase I